MDPIAHTLVGAALAKSGLEKRSGFAFAALVLGANLPDIDGVTYFVSADLGLYFRRGWTHGLPAIAVWPFLLAGALTLLDRALGFRRARFEALFGLSLLAVATHPALDWLNNYGMRWLMPLDGRWFYGDAVFIIDPWIWLGLGGPLFLSSSRSSLRLLAWIAGAAAPIYAVLGTVPGLAGAKALFAAGLAGFAAARVLGFPRTEFDGTRLHQVAVALVSAYILTMVALSAFAHRWTFERLTAEGHQVEKLMVGPTPLSPFTKDVVFSTPSTYGYGVLAIGSGMKLTLSPGSIARTDGSPFMARALREPEVQGFANWARFPWAEVFEEPEGVRVILRDARYTRFSGRSGFGTAVVVLPR
jgi:inner membrane protein